MNFDWIVSVGNLLMLGIITIFAVAAVRWHIPALSRLTKRLEMLGALLFAIQCQIHHVDAQSARIETRIKRMAA